MDDMNTIPKDEQGGHQAMNTDYEGTKQTDYVKGHLYPIQHTSNHDAMLATSTLTNAAPQEEKFNNGAWKSHEGALRKLYTPDNPVYIVTGVVPGKGTIGTGVRVAQVYWSAYCCLNCKIKSEGYWGPENNGQVVTLTLSQLEARLTILDNMQFSVFGEQC